jgi:hypothetical protein
MLDEENQTMEVNCEVCRLAGNQRACHQHQSNLYQLGSNDRHTQPMSLVQVPYWLCTIRRKGGLDPLFQGLAFKILIGAGFQDCFCTRRIYSV